MDALGENRAGMLSDGGSIPLTSTIPPSNRKVRGRFFPPPLEKKPAGPVVLTEPCGRCVRPAPLRAVTTEGRTFPAGFMAFPLFPYGLFDSTRA